MKPDRSEEMRHRLHRATQALKEATEEFVAAHAKRAGGHAPVLWATYLDCDEAVVVCHRSWAEKIGILFDDLSQPVYTIQLEDLGEET